MTVSQYVRFIKCGNRYFVFNILTKAILEIDNVLFNILISRRIEHTNSNDELLDQDSIKILMEKGILVNSNQEIKEYCHELIKWNREREDFLHLTILPTLDCCCACYYCFEKNRTPVYMDESVIDSIIEFIKANNRIQRLHITWFGGEPLMAKSVIKNFNNKLLRNFRGLYSSDLITNGIYLNEDAIKLIDECNISEVQISLDGLKENHNKIKRCKVVDDPYEAALSNVERLIQAIPYISINLRVNFAKDNISEFIESYRYLSKRFNDKVFISPGFLVNKNSTICVEGKSCSFFNLEDKYSCALNLWQNYRIPTGRILNNDYTLECAIRNKAALVIGPNGELYKCWEHVGTKSKQIGIITRKGIVINHSRYNQIITLLEKTDPLRLTICNNCEYLPICYGGCPIERNHTTDVQKCFLNPECYEGLLKSHLEYLILSGRV